MPKVKLSFLERQKSLLDKISKAKLDLEKLKTLRQKELTHLLMKHQLDQYDNKILDNAFAELAQTLRTKAA